MIPFLAALVAGAVGGAAGFGSGAVLAVLVVTGAPLLDSLACVKILAAVCDAAALAGFVRSGRFPVRAIGARPLLVCAGGAGLAALVVSGAPSSGLLGAAGVACVACLVWRARGSPISLPGVRRLAFPLGFGAYLAAFGFGAGSLWTARRMLGGMPGTQALAEARAPGFAGNAAAAAVYAVVLPVAWETMLPVVAGHLVGAYGAARWTGVLAKRLRRLDLPWFPVRFRWPAVARAQSVPSRCISEQVSQRLPPRPSTCE